MHRSSKLVLWFVFCLALLGCMLAAFGTRAEVCLNKVDGDIAKKPGYRWQWRTVDGRKCWFYANTLLPKEDLVWSYTEQEFNSDIERVIERKFYFPENKDAD